MAAINKILIIVNGAQKTLASTEGNDKFGSSLAQGVMTFVA